MACIRNQRDRVADQAENELDNNERSIEPDADCEGQSEVSRCMSMPSVVIDTSGGTHTTYQPTNSRRIVRSIVRARFY